MSADIRLPGHAQQIEPAGFERHEKHVLSLILVLVLWVRSRVLTFSGSKPGIHIFERIRDVLKENQAEHHMLVLGGVDVLAQLVGGFPELLFQWFFFAWFNCFGRSHYGSLSSCENRGSNRYLLTRDSSLGSASMLGKWCCKSLSRPLVSVTAEALVMHDNDDPRRAGC